jgi:hypothetical protein
MKGHWTSNVKNQFQYGHATFRSENGYSSLSEVGLGSNPSTFPYFVRYEQIPASLNLFLTYYIELRMPNLARYQWLTPVILTTQEAEIRRTMV